MDGRELLYKRSMMKNPLVGSQFFQASKHTQTPAWCVSCRSGDAAADVRECEAQSM